MTFKVPAEITKASIASGCTKCSITWQKLLILGFLAGAYIAFGALLSEIVAGGLSNGTITAADGSIWKIVFTGYGGSANGNFIFNQELASAASVAEGAAATVLVHPNPASNGFATLVIDAPQGGLFLDLLDRSGRVVRQQRVMGSGLVRERIDLGGVPSGLYLVRLQGEGLSATARLVVE